MSCHPPQDSLLICVSPYETNSSLVSHAFLWRCVSSMSRCENLEYSYVCTCFSDIEWCIPVCSHWCMITPQTKIVLNSQVRIVHVKWMSDSSCARPECAILCQHIYAYSKLLFLVVIQCTQCSERVLCVYAIWEFINTCECVDAGFPLNWWSEWLWQFSRVL